MKAPRKREQLQLDLLDICLLIRTSVTIERDLKAEDPGPECNLSCAVSGLLSRHSLLTSVWALTFCVSHIKTIYNILAKAYFPPLKRLRMPPCSIWSLWQRFPGFTSTYIFNVYTTALRKWLYLLLSLFCYCKSIQLLPQ